MANKSKFKLTLNRLRELASIGRSIDDETVKMLERVLVNGESQSKVAADFGKTQQFVSDRVKNIYKRMTQQANVIPPGFVVREIIVHKDDLDAITEIETRSLERVMSSRTPKKQR
ncbi:MAG: hypothetical protein ACJAU1_000435 [Psychromonas sp.]|jgi:hypothetical protein